MMNIKHKLWTMKETYIILLKSLMKKSNILINLLKISKFTTRKNSFNIKIRKRLLRSSSSTTKRLNSSIIINKKYNSIIKLIHIWLIQETIKTISSILLMNMLYWTSISILLKPMTLLLMIMHTKVSNHKISHFNNKTNSRLISNMNLHLRNNLWLTKHIQIKWKEHISVCLITWAKLYIQILHSVINWNHNLSLALITSFSR